MKFITRKSDNIVSTLLEETEGNKYSLIVFPYTLLTKENEEAVFGISNCSLLTIHMSKIMRISRSNEFVKGKNVDELDVVV